MQINQKFPTILNTNKQKSYILLQFKLLKANNPQESHANKTKLEEDLDHLNHLQESE